MKITEILNPAELIKMKALGYVKEQSHPTFPELRILNYTASAQFDNMWNEVTETCRGLIYNWNTGEVVARPFRKFFNYGQSGAADLSLDTEVLVMDKLDGSLGILYQTPDKKFAIATRGSFASDQAVHATKVLNEKYSVWLEENFAALQIVTPMFEIIYPENRIVCDYREMDDLVLLGAEHLSSKGGTWDSDQAAYFFDWKGPVAKIFDYDTFGEVLAAKPRKGAEGFVVFAPKTGQRVKIKQADYIDLHRIITGLNARSVWSIIKDAGSISSLLRDLPDEFHDWTKKIAEDLMKKHSVICNVVLDDYEKIYRKVLAEMGGADSRSREYRKEFAKKVNGHPYASYLFLYLDGKSFGDKVWDLLKPEGNLTPSGKNFAEDDN